MSRKVKKFGHLYFMLFFPIVMTYYELLFRIGTVGDLFKWSTLYLLFFTFAYAGIGYLLSSLFKNRKVNKIICASITFVTGIIYLVEFLVYKFFKVFYDINTVTGAAGDAATTYTTEIFQLILRNIWAVLLFIAPTVLYIIFSDRIIPAYKSKASVRIVSCCLSVLSFVLASLLVTSSSIYGPIYKSQYNFQSAVGDFGLATGLRLDVKYLLFGRESGFENTDPQNNDTSQDDTPIEYGKNELDLDFDALNEGASSKIKNLNAYVSTLKASSKNEYTGLFKDKNLILISAEAFTAEVIDPNLTPTLYRLANKGIQFTDYYQPTSAGTTGGEYQNIFGMLPMA